MANVDLIQDEIAQDEQIADIQIMQKNGQPYLAADGTPCTIGVRGSDAKAVRQAREVVQRKALRDRRTRLEPADLRANRITIVTAAVARWHGWTSGDVEFPCTPDNVRAMLEAEHILEQVEVGIAGHSDFFSKS